MRTDFLYAVTLIGCLATGVTSYCQNSSAKTEFDLGVSAYRYAKYEEAILHLNQAVLLDPSFVPAHLYLASGYAQQYIPGVDVSDNTRMAQLAIAQFEQVPTLNATHDQQVSALKGIASLYMNMKELERAKHYDRKVLEIEPNDSEAYFSIGVIDWTESYQLRMEQRAKLNLKPDDLLIKAAECWEIQSKNEGRVKDGIEMLTKAISIRPSYDDAMAYMNLMYRECADIQCWNAQAYRAYIKAADDWADVTIATKKANAGAAR